MGKISTIIISLVVSVLTLIGVSCLIAYKYNKSGEDKTNKNKSFPEANIDSDKKKENSLSLKDKLNNSRKRALLEKLKAFDKEKEQYNKKMRKAELYGNENDKIKIQMDYTYKIMKYFEKFGQDFSNITWSAAGKDKFEAAEENFLISFKKLEKIVNNGSYIKDSLVGAILIQDIHTFAREIEFILWMESLDNKW